MNVHDLAQERAQKLRIALIYEWKRIKLDLAKSEKSSIHVHELQAHADAIVAVLATDRDIEAKIWKMRDEQELRDQEDE